MNIDNIGPKVNNQLVSNPYKKTSVGVTHSQSFGSAALGNGVIGLMDAVDRGGLVASFLIQDFFGMNLPRTATGLYRNKDITGKYNYQEAAEVGIREFMSGPTMFAVPMLMLWGIKRMFGKANDVPINVIRTLGSNFAEHAASKTVAELSDVKTIKASFYEDTFRNILKNAYQEGTPQEVIDKEAKKFAADLIEYEGLKDSKKTMKFVDKLRGKRVEGTAETKLADMVSRFSEISKSNSKNPSANFLNATVTSSERTVAKSLDKLVVDMRNFVEDASSSIAKQAKKNSLSGDGVKQFIKKFVDFRSGSRALSNAAMVIGTIMFCSIIPKLYQLSDKNPGLAGIEDTPENTKTPAKQDNAKKVAFSGAIDGLGKRMAKDGWGSKFMKRFEFDGYNMSYDTLLTVCGLGVLVPRLYHAREENEYKEVLYRDTTTILTVAGAAKILQKVVAAICTKVTGLALAIRPAEAKNSTWANVWSHIKPVTGTSVMTSSELYSKYTNIHQYKNGVADFARFIDEQGGNISKAFNVDKNAKNLLKELYDASSKASTVSFENAKNADIIAALDDVVKNGKAKEALEKMYTIFKDGKNTFLRKAKVMNSSFNFALLFFVAPVLLGYVIPKFNETLTKKRQMEKHQHNDKTAQTSAPSTVNTQKANTTYSSQNGQNVQKTMNASTAFKNFIKP